jgi:hypothetical protein
MNKGGFCSRALHPHFRCADHPRRLRRSAVQSSGSGDRNRLCDGARFRRFESCHSRTFWRVALEALRRLWQCQPILSYWFMVIFCIALHRRCRLCAFGFPCSSIQVAGKVRGSRCEKIGEPDSLRFASNPDALLFARRAKIRTIRERSVAKFNDETCEFRKLSCGFV